MSDITTAFWGMVINNYDETDLALVRQGYPDYIRKITFTLEEGEQGTPHIQAWLKLNRQQRLSYVKKLFPRGNFKALTSDEYKLNAEAYSTKQDDTARSASVIVNNPFPDPVVELTSVIEEVFRVYTDRPFYVINEKEFYGYARIEERNRVREKPSLAKFYVSATYKNVKKEFWDSIASHVYDKQQAEKKEAKKLEHTHTHTHSDEKFSVAEDITDAEDSEEGESDVECEEEGVCESDEECSGEEVERSSEGGSVSGSETDDSEGSRE